MEAAGGCRGPGESVARERGLLALRDHEPEEEMRVRKIVGSVLVVVATVGLPACRSAAPAPSAAPVAQAGPGAGTPSAAVERFLEAARATEVSAMAQLFGTAGGPITDIGGACPHELDSKAIMSAAREPVGEVPFEPIRRAFLP